MAGILQAQACDASAGRVREAAGPAAPFGCEGVKHEVSLQDCSCAFIHLVSFQIQIPLLMQGDVRTADTELCGAA